MWGDPLLRPIQIGQLVEVHAQVIHTGTTSMHLAVDVYSRHPTETERHKTTHCIIIFVAMDEQGKPTPVPQWQPVSESDLQLQQYAKSSSPCARRSTRRCASTSDLGDSPAR